MNFNCSMLLWFYILFYFYVKTNNYCYSIYSDLGNVFRSHIKDFRMCRNVPFTKSFLYQFLLSCIKIIIFFILFIFIVDIPSGESALLSCDIDIALTIKWQKYNGTWTTLSYDSTGKYNGIETNVLTITNTQISDSAAYRCAWFSSTDVVGGFSTETNVRVLG